MICNKCKQDKTQSNFRKNKHGLTKVCNECRGKKIAAPTKKYILPDGHGGKWKFNMDNIQLDYDAREFMRLYGKRNPNVRKCNRNNIMLVTYDKSKLEWFAQIAEMNPKAVYELPYYDKPSKWAVILYY